MPYRQYPFALAQGIAVGERSAATLYINPASAAAPGGGAGWWADRWRIPPKTDETATLAGAMRGIAGGDGVESGLKASKVMYNDLSTAKQE